MLATWWKLTSFDLWQDDNALIFKVQHPQEQVGVFGAGELGVGAYRYVAYPYILLSKIVGINIPVFYLIGLVAHLVTSIAVFFLCKILLKKKEIAYLSSFLFSISYLGSESLIRLFNSIQTSLSILFFILCFVYFYLYKIKNSIIFYVFSIACFFLAIEIGYVRMQYSFVPLLFFWIFFVFNFKKKFSSLLAISFYVVIYIYEYVFNADSRTQLLATFIEQLTKGKIEFLFSFFASIGYLFVPDLILAKIFDLTSIAINGVARRLYVIEATVFLGQMLSILFLLGKKKKKLFFAIVSQSFWLVIYKKFLENIYSGDLAGHQAVNLLAAYIGGAAIINLGIFLPFMKSYKRLYLFLWVWVFSNVGVYSVYLPFVPLETSSRYLSHSVTPFVIALGLILYSVRKHLFINYQYIFSFIILINIFFSFFYIQSFYLSKMLPIKNFYMQLKSFVSEIEKNSIIFFEVADDLKSRQEFADFFSVGSMPDTTAIAIRYDLDRYDIKMSQNFNEIIKEYSLNPNKKVYTFYYGDGLLSNKTSEFSKLMNKKRFKVAKDSVILNSELKELEEGTVAINTINRLTDFNNVPIFPMEFSFEARVSVNNFTPSAFPLQIVQEREKEKIECRNSLKGDEIKKYYEAKNSERKIFEITKPKTQSAEKNYEEYKLMDQDVNSVWRGSRGYWMENKKEQINIEFDELVSVSMLEWFNSYPDTSPIDYIIEISTDGINWEAIKSEKSQEKKLSGWISELLGNRKVKFIKFTVFDTYEHDSPAISEIRIVESGIDRSFTDKVNELLEAEPCFHDFQTYLIAKEANVKVLRNFKITVVTTDKRIEKKLDLIQGDGFFKYKTDIDLKGLNIKEVIFGPTQFPANVEIKNIEFSQIVGT